MDRPLVETRPGALASALGAAGVVGGLVLLAAFVIDISPEINWIRLALFNVGAIAVAIALTLGAAAPRAAVVLTASAVTITNTAHLAMTVLSLGVERPFAGTFGWVYFVITIAMWLSDASFGAALASGRNLTAGLTGRLAAITLAVGSLPAIIGMDRVGLVSPERESIFKTLALAGVFLNGLAWVVVGLVVVTSPRR